MKLHKNQPLFADIIKTVAGILDMPQEFVEKDYWICHILQQLSRHENSEFAVWKGGTTLAKVYGLINRFSSDIDIAVLTATMSQNQQKKFVARISRDSTLDLEEVDVEGQTVKNNRFRKTYHAYKSVVSETNVSLAFLDRFVIFEINTYGNPYPYERKTVKSFITEVFEQRELSKEIEQYDMAPFELNVLDKRRTMCEKIVSLIRFSFENDSIAGLASKIRHFYDLYFLSKDKECQEYLNGDFPKNLIDLIVHDKTEFDRPSLWKGADILTSVLLTDFDAAWKALTPKYKSELGELTYGELPKPEEISASVRSLMKYVKSIIEISSGWVK